MNMHSQIRKFFDKHIARLHTEHAAGNLPTLDLRFGSPADSYFTEPLHAGQLYLTNIPFDNAGALQIYLEDFWKDEPRLLQLVPDLVKLAFALKEENREQSAELSPFVYAMF